MQEWHSRHGRGGGDDGDQNLDAPVMPSRRQPRTHEHVRDQDARIRDALDYRKRVDAEYAAYEAGQLEQHSRSTTPDNTDKPADRIARRRDSPQGQKEEQRHHEGNWLPTNETTQFAVGISVAATSVVDTFNIVPGKVDAVATSLLGALVAGVAWGNKRWKDKHGDRPGD